jgi:hypothetical protein
MGEGAERARIAKQEQQQDAAREGWQRQGELHDEAEERHGAASPPGQQIAERDPSDRDQQASGRGAQQRDGGGAGEAGPVGASPICRTGHGDAGGEGGDEVEGEETAEPGQDRPGRAPAWSRQARM